MTKEIIMIHGWGTQAYNSSVSLAKNKPDIAWKDRQVLVKQLAKKYPLRFFNLPGFCGVGEPKKKFFDLEDFSNYLDKWLKFQGITPLAIVGYSFGGAVALDYKVRFRSKSRIILVSPALKRRDSFKSIIGRLAKNLVPPKYTKTLKSLYQSLFSTYYHEGSTFLRKSYDKIVRRDTRSQLTKVLPEDMLLVFGNSDTSTPYDYVSSIVKRNKLNCTIIPGGDHNIGETHPRLVSSAIIRFLSK